MAKLACRRNRDCHRRRPGDRRGRGPGARPRGRRRGGDGAAGRRGGRPRQRIAAREAGRSPSPATSATGRSVHLRSRKPCGVLGSPPSSSTMPARLRRSASSSTSSRTNGRRSSTSISSAPRRRAGGPSCNAPAGRGTIVNVSSGAAHRAMEGWSAYCASKAGLDMLTNRWRSNTDAVGMRVFGFAPGIVDTEMQASIRASGIGPIAKLPRDMLASPSEPAAAIAFLCSPGGAVACRPGARHPRRRFPGGRRPGAGSHLTEVRKTRRLISSPAQRGRGTA